MKSKLLTQAKFLARRFEPMDMSRVLDLVFLLDCAEDEVYYKANVQSVCDVCCLLYSRLHASDREVEIWFVGGPPGEEEWFGGTLYNFVIDRLMRELANSTPAAVIRKLKITTQVAIMGCQDAS